MTDASKQSLWYRLQLLFPRRRSSMLQDCVTTRQRADGALQKVICGVFHDKPPPDDLITSLSTLSGYPIGQRDSDVRFGGGYFWYGGDATTSIYVVPSGQLWRLPWYLQRDGWHYVRIHCQLDDERFSQINGYTFVPTPNAGDIN